MGELAVTEDDLVIAVDGGLSYCGILNVEPDLIIGDFDSMSDGELQALEVLKQDIPERIITLPCEKDDTDTVFAMKEAIRRGYTDFLFIGVIGGRLDHTLGNVSMLLYLETLGLTGRILDDYSCREIVSRREALVEDAYAFFSLLNISGTARGICIENAKYPLQDGEITCEYQYGVSNEVLPGKTARITVGEGRLLLIKDL